MSVGEVVEHEHARDHDQHDAEGRAARAAAHHMLAERPVVALLRDQEPGEDVEQDPRAPEHDQGGEGDAEEHRVEAEVLPQAAADAGQHAVAAAAPQRAAVGGLAVCGCRLVTGRGLVVAHGPIIRTQGRLVHRGAP